jgi:hypothetical protein
VRAPTYPYPDGSAGPHDLRMAYRATAAHHCIDHDRAVSALHAELQQRAARDGSSPDWSTMRVVGPEEIVDTDGRVRYEWTATVDGTFEPARQR